MQDHKGCGARIRIETRSCILLHVSCHYWLLNENVYGAFTPSNPHSGTQRTDSARHQTFGCRLLPCHNPTLRRLTTLNVMGIHPPILPSQHGPGGRAPAQPSRGWLRRIPSRYTPAGTTLPEAGVLHNLPTANMINRYCHVVSFDINNCHDHNGDWW